MLHDYNITAQFRNLNIRPYN